VISHSNIFGECIRDMMANASSCGMGLFGIEIAGTELVILDRLQNFAANDSNFIRRSTAGRTSEHFASAIRSINDGLQRTLS
jgi:hypothetical protein